MRLCHDTSMKKLKVTEDRRSLCPISNTLDVIGDKWTLLIIRDILFLDKKQYGDFLNSSEGIATNILADRLKKLEIAGIIEKRPYQAHPPRYEYIITDRGRALKPVIFEMTKWGVEHIEGVYKPKAAFIKKAESA